jgi:hypothetical protein
MACIFWIARKPMLAIASNRNVKTVAIFVRIEMLVSTMRPFMTPELNLLGKTATKCRVLVFKYAMSGLT